MFANQEACLNVSASLFLLLNSSLLTNLTLSFTEAWRDITSTDALVDSGEESGGDEYTRADYGTFYLSNLLSLIDNQN
jgi:hypothetical protein